MSKEKVTSAAENTAAEAPATKVAEQPTTEQPTTGPAENQEEDTTPEVNDLNTVVVMCYKGTVDVMSKIWKKQLPEGVNIILKELAGTTAAPNTEALTGLLTSKEIPAGFIYVPANVIPCCLMNMNDLMLPVVYVKKSGQRVYNSNLPMFVEKEALMELLEEIDQQLSQLPDQEIDECLLKAYLERYASRPVEVSHNFGNFVTLVARANPCIHTVIEGFLRKKFVTVTDPAGFNAITPDLIKAYNLDNE